MKAMITTGIQKMEMKEAMRPKPEPGQVLVKIEYCGICGSDVHFYKDGRIGDHILEDDIVLGHEVSGIVTELGENVTQLQVGDRVALEPGIACGKCIFCKSGSYNLCPEMVFFADPPVSGALQEYVVHPADLCFKLPDNVSTMEGALVEPLSVGLHAAGMGDVKLGQSVIILGTGCIGLVTLLACKARGAAQIVVVDLYDKRLEFARKLGATHTINAKKDNVEDKIKEIFSGQGADVVFETAGSIVTIAQTPFLAKRGGTIVLVGQASESKVSYNFAEVMIKELTIKSVFRYRNSYPVAIAALSTKSIDVKQIVTHEFEFKDSKLAFDTVIKDAENVVKGVIRF